MCVYHCRNNKDMKQLINLLNTTLQNQPKQARPDSASGKAPLSSVAAARDDNSDVAVVRPQMPRPNLGVTFVKASPTVIQVPSDELDEPDGGDVGYGAEPRFQLGMVLIKVTFVNQPSISTDLYHYSTCDQKRFFYPACFLSSCRLSFYGAFE